MLLGLPKDLGVNDHLLGRTYAEEARREKRARLEALGIAPAAYTAVRS